MEQVVRVQKVFPNGTAQVLRIRESACSGDCHKCSGCGAAQQKLLLTVQNPVGASEGDRVVIQAETAPVLKAAAMLYLLPLAMFFVGYVAGSILVNLGGALGCIGFAVGIAGVIAYDRFVVRKKKTVYTITGFAA
jgi:sigma-E factor negative regulatory protein RseC